MKTNLAMAMTEVFQPFNNNDLLFTTDLSQHFKNKHASHLCFVDDDGASDATATDASDDKTPPSLLGDDQDTDAETDKDKDTDEDESKDTDKDTDEDDKDKGKDEGAPEKYDLKLPDGYSVDESAMEKFEPLFRELNLNNDQASKLAAAYGELNQDVADKVQAEVTEQLEQQFFDVNKAWQKAINEDKEYGGADIQQNLNVARGVIDRFANDKAEAKAIRGALKETGAGNHPEVMRLLYRIGKAMAEDKLSPINGGSSKEKNFYPNSPGLK